MGIKLEQINDPKLRRRILDAANDHPTRSPLPDTKPERNKTPALGQATEGEASSLRRVSVCFVGYRTRLLDWDNHAASIKNLLDGLRHAALIEGDDLSSISVRTEQVKVAHRKDERTEIEIIYP